MNKNTRTLVITQSFLPHQIVSIERAMVMIMSGKIERVDEIYDEDLGIIRESRLRDFPHVCRAYDRDPSDLSGDLFMKTPCVIRMKRAVPHIKHGVKFSRVNVFTRDGYRCQYCRNVFNPSELNFDHVIPRTLGGKTVWENIVASCYSCNAKKAGRTPEQAKMVLLKKPFKPKWLPMVGPRFSPHDSPDKWIPYLGSQFQTETASVA